MKDLRINAGAVVAAGERAAAVGKALDGALTPLRTAAALSPSPGFHIDEAVVHVSRRSEQQVTDLARAATAAGDAAAAAGRAHQDLARLQVELIEGVLGGGGAR